MAEAEWARGRGRRTGQGEGERDHWKRSPGGFWPDLTHIVRIPIDCRRLVRRLLEYSTSEIMISCSRIVKRERSERDSESILKVEEAGFADGLSMKWRGKRNVRRIPAQAVGKKRVLTYGNNEGHEKRKVFGEGRMSEMWGGRCWLSTHVATDVMELENLNLDRHRESWARDAMEAGGLDQVTQGEGRQRD